MRGPAAHHPEALCRWNVAEFVRIRTPSDEFRRILTNPATARPQKGRRDPLRLFGWLISTCARPRRACPRQNPMPCLVTALGTMAKMVPLVSKRYLLFDLQFCCRSNLQTVLKLADFAADSVIPLSSAWACVGLSLLTHVKAAARTCAGRGKAARSDCLGIVAAAPPLSLFRSPPAIE